MRIYFCKKNALMVSVAATRLPHTSRLFSAGANDAGSSTAMFSAVHTVYMGGIESCGESVVTAVRFATFKHRIC